MTPSTQRLSVQQAQQLAVQQAQQNQMSLQAQQAPTPSLMDYLHYPGAMAALTQGLGNMKRGVSDSINHLPSLPQVRQFFSDFGNALSTGVANARQAPQRFDNLQDSVTNFKQSKNNPFKDNQ